MSRRHPTRTITRAIRTRRPKRPDEPGRELEVEAWPEDSITVGEVMTQAPLAITADTSVRQAWHLMRDGKFRHLPVLDARRTVVGIVTDRDLRQVILEPMLAAQLGQARRTLAGLAVRDVMTWGVVTVDPRSDLRQAARILREQRIGALPVIDRGRLVGMLTGTDVLKALLRIMDEGVISKTARWRTEG